MGIRTANQIKAEIDALRDELDRISPAESLSVRKIAKIAGISPATAHRFKSGRPLDVPTVKALMAAKLIPKCPVCGTAFSAPALAGDHDGRG